MSLTPMSLSSFETILILTDWEAKKRSPDPTVSIDGHTSIAYAADCFLALSVKDQARAKILLKKYLPVGWKGWPVVVRAAVRSRKAFQKAISIGTFSDNKYVSDYYGNYFYTHSEGGRDFFKNRSTFLCVESPYSKSEIAKRANKSIFWNTRRS